MEEQITCEKCKNEAFILDEDRSGFEPPNPMPISAVKIDGKINYTYKAYYKCSKCGWQYPNSIEGINTKITYTFQTKKP
jgi:DNA-directed RNA polymerase subunit RPC12/RpoP